MIDRQQGIITVLNTPFAADDSIDLPGLTRNVQDALEAGVAGFLVPAMASETDLLTQNEKHSIVRQVVDLCGRSAVVIGGASAPDRRQRKSLAAEFLQLGCDGVLLAVDPSADVAVLQDELQDLATLNPTILMVQDWDSDGPGLPIAAIQQLCTAVPAFNWLKIEVNNAGPKYTEVLTATDGRLRVAGGWAVTQMIDGLDRGVHAFMPTGMHRIYVEICCRYAAGDRAGAVTLFDQIRPVLSFSNQSLDVSIRFFKRLLWRQNVYATPNVRISGPDFDTNQCQLADDLIRQIIQLEEQLATSRSS